ncbi:MAG: ABC transporter ATP-binding protein [Phycisphaerales bacterium]|nr:ABC transporter ATP-binding protein [Phycisphaerales bacterium]
MSSNTAPMPVLEARNLGKSYIMYPTETRRHFALVTGKQGDAPSHCALKDLDLDLYPGECLGIVGRNGAGKSTLLQLICGTLQPTTGTVQVNGRISPLLELASGFSPDFTGRDNVFQKAAILGLTRKQTEERFDKIAEFADIGDFLDRPVRIYSSGMLARLAFAVSIHVDADILVLDEILAVGDAAFQRKCHARIAQLRSEGTAILLVSHSTGAITSACSRAILIDNGQCLLSADPKTVVSWYHRLLDASPADESTVRQEILQASTQPDDHPVPSTPSTPQAAQPSNPTPPQSTPTAQFNPNMVSKSINEWDRRGATIEHVRIEDNDGRRVNMLVRHQSYEMVYEVLFERSVSYARFGMLIRNTEGLDVFGCCSNPPAEGVGPVASGQRFTVRFRFRAALAQSAYFCCAGVLGPACGNEHSEEIYLHRIFDATVFRIQASRTPMTAGYADLSEHPQDDPYGQSLVSIEHTTQTPTKQPSNP